jgi:predicted ATPase/DNA-binding SARP family transcriptional activator
MTELHVRLLGPIEASVGNGQVALGGAKQRLVLVLLALAEGRVVPTDRLVDAVWGERPAPSARRTLQVYVSTLRKALADAGADGEPLAREGAGYRLAVPAEGLDHAYFSRLLKDGQARLAAGNAEDASRLLREAIELWRGPALDDLADEIAVSGEARRLEELRTVCVEERIDADLALGRHAELVSELEYLVVRLPLRERLRGQLMLALYRSERQAEALDAYQAARATLVDELGIDPSPTLQALHLQILNQDPTLEAPTLAEPSPVDSPELPVPPTRFVGRADELAALRALVTENETRLVTLTGPGGMGKTRLALQAAGDTAASFPDGVFWVSLAPLREGEHVLPAIARVLDVYEEADRTLLDAIRAVLSGRRCLIVLDNCEQVISAAADAVSALRTSQGPTFLATSRERLNLQAEQLFPVQSLAIDDAVQLFDSCARYANPSHQPGSPDVLALCEGLDALPLALELAAAQSDLHSPSELLEAVSTALDAFEGSREHDPRHQTLRATIDWGYELLGAEQQRVYRALSAMAGGCSLAAAQAVCDAGTDSLHFLVSKSFIRTSDSANGRRFSMLETIRAHAAESLAGAGEAESVTTRHCVHFTDVAAEAEVLAAEIGVPDAVARLADETGNFRVALAHAQHAAPEAAMRACIGLRGVMLGLGMLRDVVEISQVAIANAPDASPELLARALTTAGTAAYTIGEFDIATPCLEQAIELLRDLDDPAQLARALNNQGVNFYNQNNWTEARPFFSESLQLLQEIGDDLAHIALANLSALALSEGDFDTARPLAEKVFALAEDGSQERVHALVVKTLIELCGGDAQQALDLSRYLLSLAEEIGVLASSDARWVAARCELRAGSAATARELLTDSLSYFAADEDALFINEPLLACATVASAHGNHHDALQLVGAAEALGEGLGASYDEVWISEVRVAAGQVLSAEQATARIVQGSALSRSAAIELAQHSLAT